ncbi:MAG: TonB-dependent receptor [Pyrinomonadaceae bacterium]
MKRTSGGGLLRALALCLLTLTHIVFSQDLDEFSLHGKIVDINNDSIVGAKVTATLISTGSERSAVTDESGRYRLIELPPGTYFLQVSAGGFETKRSKEFQGAAAQSLRLNFSLSVVGINEEQTIRILDDDLPVVDEGRTIVGSAISQTEIEDLPNPSNDVLDLVYLIGGTAEEPLSIRDLASDDRIGNGSETDQPTRIIGTGTISLSGGAAYSTNITIDGMDNNDDREAGERFQPPAGAVAEVQVITNQFSAEYGRASGGRVNIRTKGGANDLRGEFSFFFEDDGLNANTYNNNRRGLSRLPYTELEPGFSLSGAIPISYFKNRTFFFAAYQYRDREAETRIFTALPVDQNPRFPLPLPTAPESARPDQTGGTALIATYEKQVGTPSYRHGFSGRIDHRFSDKHNANFGIASGRSTGFSQYRETTRYLEETLQGRIRNTDSYNFTDNFVVNSGFVNQLRFQYSTLKPEFVTQNPLDPVVLLRLYDEENPDAEERINGTVVVGNSTGSFSSQREERRYQIQETANFAVGDLTLRFGLDVQRIISTINELPDTTGTFNFESADGFLADQVVRYRRNTAGISKVDNKYYGFFGQADWKVKPNVTLGFGLRYERESVVDDKNNFGPRFGVAYSPGQDKRSVFRFGSGIFYNRTLLRTIDDFLIDQVRQQFDSNLLQGTTDEPRCFTDPSFAAGFDECRFLIYAAQRFPAPLTIEQIKAVPGINNIGLGFTQDIFTRTLEGNIKIPESYQFNLGFERDLGRSFVFEANFTYNKTIRLWRERNINAFQVPVGFDNFTDYLISLGDIEIPGTTSGTDIYRFVLGDPADTNGDVNSETGADCNSSTPLCIVNLNTLNGSTATLEPIGIARRTLLATIGLPFSNIIDGQIEEVGSMGRSVYEGLSIEMRRRFKNLGFGLSSSIRVTYVLSRMRDDGLSDTSSAQIAGDFAGEFGRSGLYRRHRLRISGIMELPRWLGRLRMSPVLRLESGRPFNISIGGDDRNLDDVSNDRPNYTGDLGDIVWHHPNDPFPQSLFEKFSLAPIGSRGGDLPNNAGNGPALFDLDLNVSREFLFGERFRIKPQITFSNLLNATVYNFGTNFIGLENAGSPEFERGFLTPSRTMTQRKIQIGIRIGF